MKYVFWLLLLSGLAGPVARAQTLLNGQVRPVKRFNAIRIGNGIALDIVAGREQRLEVGAATTEFRDRIRTTVTDGLLLISYDDMLERDNRKLLRVEHKLRVAVTTELLTMLTAGSGSAVTGQGSFAAPDCVLDINSGASCTATGLSPAVLVVRLNSGGSATLEGQAPRLDVRALGGSTLNAERLQSVRGQVEASGGSTVRVAVRDVLLVEVSGKSEVRYAGTPTLTQDVGEDSKLKKLN